MTVQAFVEDPHYPKTEEIGYGVVACVLLSTVVPILPTLTSITMGLAFFAACVAMASMFVTYPIALLSDALDGEDCCPSPGF